jgi:DNA mismatch repair protein MutH
MRDEVAALLRHARALVGTTLAELAEGLDVPVPAGARNTKGWSGRIIEHELGAGGSQRAPDFEHLGIELKTVPVHGDGSPLESTAVCHIDPVAIAGESWDTSYTRKKLSTVLFIALHVPDKAVSVGERIVAAARLWSPSPAEEALLRADFEQIVRGYFRTGRANELTGHLGKVLQVRPKGRDASDKQDGFDAQGNPTRLGRCGFYLRPAFVRGILAAPDPPDTDPL